ncbi:MAG TPA: OmcA/MtrC family decaheme c-type cytochrome [Bryobacteraceae bacterium]|nr:OmcA/MtrC family decaheme c-type cytochrome [Bryobacteraceae bacterium]
MHNRTATIQRLFRLSFGWRPLAIVLSAVTFLASAPKPPYSPNQKAFYADAALVNFVRPGLALKITAAQMAADGTITATLSITDPQGLPLDRNGITTPGAVSISMVAATIPKGQTQYVAYTTRTQKSPITGQSAIQAAADSGGVFTPVSDGVYKYTFGTRAPAGFDAAATHTIGAYASRDLTIFGLGVSYASTTFNFVPNGSQVRVTRDVVRTQACDACHDQLSAHGGSRRGVELCILCHTPQTTDPDTGNTLDFKVMAHKIHAGSSLPSVRAGKPYRLIGFNQSVSDWSTVVYPADVRRCETCHRQDVGADQATNYLTAPTAASCGSCHDDVDFTTGVNHAGGPQISDNLCGVCHIPQGEIDFDASIKGAHVIPTESAMLSGLVVSLVKVDNGVAGSAPTVTFTVRNKAGNAVPLSALGALSFTMAGPASDYGYTSFGSDVTTPGYVTESALGASCSVDGTCMYTFTHSIPANATGTYSIGIEARRTETLLAGTTKQMTVQYGAINKVINFSVDNSPVQARRTVVATSKCNQCHVALSVHGTLRNQTEYCVLCHNPSNTDAARGPMSQVASDRAAPPQGVNFNLLVHRIHTGENLPANRPYIVVGFGGSHNDFSDVRYPAMAPTGAPGDTRNCAMCHVNGSEQNLPTGVNAVVDPQGPINPVQAVTSACTGCHVSLSAASHALANTTSLGESCETCHSAGAAFSVGQVHAQY